MGRSLLLPLGPGFSARRLCALHLCGTREKMSDSLLELFQARVAAEDVDWLAQVLSPVASLTPASQTPASSDMPGRSGTPVRRSHPPNRLSPSTSPAWRLPGQAASAVPAPTLASMSQSPLLFSSPPPCAVCRAARSCYVCAPHSVHRRLARRSRALGPGMGFPPWPWRKCSGCSSASSRRCSATSPPCCLSPY